MIASATFLRDSVGADVQRRPSRFTLGFVPCTIHGNLGRFRAAGAEVALVAE